MLFPQQYTDILRLSFDHDAVFSGELKSEGIDWEKLYEFAEQQGITGFLFEGVKQLSERMDVKPPQKTLLQWISVSEHIKALNIVANKRTVSIVEMFHKSGFRCCILKGQGNALRYLDRYCCTPGDIDVWVDGDKENINRFVRKTFPDATSCEHHIDYPIFPDIDVEVHFKPRYLFNPKHDKAFNEFVEENRNAQFEHSVSFLEYGKINIPTDDFNIVYQAAHMVGHFVEDGIGLRQVTDFFYLLKNRCNSETDFVPLFSKMGMLTFVRGLMWIGNSVYGLSEEKLIVKADKRAGNLILKDILDSGNLGKNGYFLRTRGQESYIKRSLFYIKRQLVISRVIKSEVFYNLKGMFFHKLEKLAKIR